MWKRLPASAGQLSSRPLGRTRGARFLTPTSQNAAMIAELNEFTGLYLFSALVQADATLMALLGVCVIFRIQTLSSPGFAPPAGA